MSEKLLDKYLEINPNFHTSVNLFLDFKDDKKANSFIKTPSNSLVLKTLKDSLAPLSQMHANILVAPYGKGKSHLVLYFLHQNPDVFPIIINGNNQDLSMQFLNTLEIALQDANFSFKVDAENITHSFNILSKNIDTISAGRYQKVMVVFDEFSKYLENTSKIDTKFLQDFAETASRNPNLNLLLITHKALSNYAHSDELAKVEGRFNEISLSNTDDESKALIKASYNVKMTKGERNFGQFYPLHETCVFLLPIISELFAQNERSLFTFLSANTRFTLRYFASRHIIGDFLTPDYLYDYFSMQFDKTNVASRTYSIHKRVEKILDSGDINSTDAKIVKTLAIILIANRFEKLMPTVDTLYEIFTKTNIIPKQNIDKSLQKLVDQKCVVYEFRQNKFLSLREFSGINIKQQINDIKLKISTTFVPIDYLNHLMLDEVIYPMRYNNENYITRFFMIKFVVNLSEQYIVKPCEYADGEIVLKYDSKIDDELLTLKAINTLIQDSNTDSIYQNELFFIKQDYLDVIENYIHNKLNEENFSEISTQFCYEHYSKYLIYNFEVLNKHNLTTQSKKACQRVIDAIISTRGVYEKFSLNAIEAHSEFEQNLPEHWTMQEKMILWTFIKSLQCDDGGINKKNPQNFLQLKKVVLRTNDNKTETETSNKTANNNVLNFGDLYNELIYAKGKFGLRLGVIPLYLARIFCEIQNDNYKVLFYDISNGPDHKIEVSFSGKTFFTINENPGNYAFEISSLGKLDETCKILADSLADYHISETDKIAPYNVANALNRWYYSLPNLTIDAHPQFSKLFSKISKPINNPSNFFAFEFNDLMDEFLLDFSKLKSKLDSYLNQQYVAVAKHFGVKVSDVDDISQKQIGLRLKDLTKSQIDSLLQMPIKMVKDICSPKQSNEKMFVFSGNTKLLNNEITAAFEEIGSTISKLDKIAVLKETLRRVEAEVL